MNPRVVLVALTLILSSYFVVTPVHGISPSRGSVPNRVIVGFWNNTSALAPYISSKYHLPVLLSDDELRFAEFSPQDMNAFIYAVKQETNVRYAYSSLQSCTMTCGSGGGSGGGGGGGTSSSPDFSISASPSYIGVLASSPRGNSQIVLTSINKFFGTVSLTSSASPSSLGNIASPSAVYVNYTGSPAYSTLDFYDSGGGVTPGRYTITVTGSWSIGGGLPTSHATTVTVDVTTDFGVDVNPSNLNIQSGQQGTSTATVASPGYSGTVNLAATVSPSVANSPTVSFGVTSLNPSQFGGVSATTLIVQTLSSTPLGVFVVTVTGTSPSASHSTTVTVTVVPNDPYYPNQWGLPDLNLPQAWGTTAGTRNRIIAVLDSGIWFDHPDLQANLWTAHGFTDVPDGRHGWDYINNGNQPVDDNGHGTEVAGIIASVANNGVGTAGEGQEQLMSIKVCYYDSNCDVGAEAKGIKWAVAHGANIINMSFATAIDDPGLRSAVSDAWKAGVILVASSGNAGELPNPPNPATGLWYPASYPEVIAVSALQEGDALWPGSLTGSKVELAAPGHDVWTTGWYPNPSYCNRMYYCLVNGTSFSAPFVSGVAALVWDYNIQQGAGAFSNQQVRDALDAYAKDLGPTGRDNSFGFGEPDVVSLFGNMVGGSHSLSLTAQWVCCFQSGNEGSAPVTIFDENSGQYIANQKTVGNKLTVNAQASHKILIWFKPYYYDGTHNVYIYSVSGSNGAPSFSDTNSLACGAVFPFSAVPASAQATYYVDISINGNNPYSGISCPPLPIRQ